MTVSFIYLVLKIEVSYANMWKSIFSASHNAADLQIELNGLQSIRKFKEIKFAIFTSALWGAKICSDKSN